MKTMPDFGAVHENEAAFDVAVASIISGDIASYRFSTLAMVAPRRRAGCGRSLPSNGRR